MERRKSAWGEKKKKILKDFSCLEKGGDISLLPEFDT